MIKNVDAYGVIYKLNIIFYLDYANGYKKYFWTSTKREHQSVQQIDLVE